MTEWIVAACLVSGATFTLVAALGVVRLPDLFTRMHAATKPATLGSAFMMLAVAVYFGELGVTTRAALVVVFFVVTAPVGAHMLGRAAYLAGVPLWEGTVVDERGRSDGAAPRPAGEPPGADPGGR